MKKWLAYMLCLCLCMMPVLACAQPITTEAVLGELLTRLVAQLQKPSLAVRLQEDEEHMEASITLDGQGIPDFSYGHLIDGEDVRFDLDAAGMRMAMEGHTMAISPQTLIRALTTDETGASLSPDVTEEDVQLLMQMAYEILGAAMSAVSFEEIPTQPAQEGESAAEPVNGLKATIDVNALLVALDTAVPAALEANADAIHALLERNQALISGIWGIDELPDVRALAQAWPQNLLAGLLTQTAVLVLEEQTDSTTCMLLLDGAVMAELACTPGRVRGVFGPEGEYVFDSDDLKTAAQLLSKLPAYISDEALICSLWQQDGSMTAHLRVDTMALITDAVTGLVCIVRDHPTQIGALLERYAPWMALADAQAAQQLSWENLYAALSDNQSRIVYGISNGVMHWMRNCPAIYPLMGSNVPWMELNLYAKAGRAAGDAPGYAGLTELVLDLKLPMLDAALTLSGQTITGSYTMGQIMRPVRHGHMAGFFSDSAAHLTLSHQSNGQTDARWTIDAEKDSAGWTALMYGIDGAEKAKLRITSKNMRLTSGSLRADLIDTGRGFNFSVSDGQKSAHGQWYAYDGVWRAEVYADGEEYTGMIAREKERELYRFTHRAPRSLAHDELQLRAEKESVLLRAGRMDGENLQQGAEVRAQWSDGLPRLTASAVSGSGRFSASYLPGKLEAGFRDSMLGENWSFVTQDVTAPQENGNTTRITLSGEEFVPAAVQNPDTPGREMEKRSYAHGWTIRTQPGADTWTVRLHSDEGNEAMLTLDFAAEATQQDLSSYAWMNEAQVRQLIGTMLAQ